MPFVNEPVPRAFIDSFDSKRLRGEFGLGGVESWPDSTWTIDKERDAALIIVDDNERTRRYGGNDTPPRRTWYALLWKGRVISFETTTGAYRVGGIAPGTEREYEVTYWRDTDIWLDDDLIDQLPEVLALARDAYFYYLRFPKPTHERVFVKGAEIRVRSVNGVAITGAAE